MSFRNTKMFYSVTYKVGMKILMIFINDKYHDSIMIFSSENIMIFFYIFDIFKISTFIIIIYILFLFIYIQHKLPSL